jgi:hypothetical protein
MTDQTTNALPAWVVPAIIGFVLGATAPVWMPVSRAAFDAMLGPSDTFARLIAEAAAFGAVAGLAIVVATALIKRIQKA